MITPRVSARGAVGDRVHLHRGLLEAIADASADGILAVAPDGQISYFNRRFVEMWNMPDDVLSARRDDVALAAVRSQIVDSQAFVDRVAYLYEHPLEHSSDELRLRDGRVIERISAPVVDDGEPAGRAWFFRDVTEERRSRSASDILAMSGEMFASPLDVDRTLSQLAELIVPQVADWAAVDVIDEHQTFRRLGVAHVRPDGAELLHELHRRYPLRANEGQLRGRVLATLEPIALYDVDEAELRTLARDELHHEMLRELGLRSAMWIPLSVRDRVLGVLSVGFAGEARRYAPSDLALLRELARRAALALDNALLYRAVQRAEVRQAALATLGQEALGGMAYLELAQRAAESLARVMDVPFVEVLELERGAHDLRLVAGVGWRDGMVGRASVKAGLGSQGGYTLATVGPVVLEDLRTETRFTPPKLLVDHAVVSGVTVVIGSPARPYGVLGAHTAERRSFAQDDVNFLQAVANVLATARERQTDDERLTALAAAEQARAAQLKGVIESIGDAVVVFDALGSVVLSNPAAATLLRGHLSEGLAGVMRAFEWPSGRGDDDTDLPPNQGVEVRLGHDGPERWIEVSAFPVLPAGDSAASSGTILVLRDVTATRNARAVREAFLGVLSHELRTPVTTIYGSSEILSRKSADSIAHDRRREIYEDIRAEADRLYRLVENLLVLSRVERQGLIIDAEPVLLQRLIPRVVDSEAARFPDATWQTSLPANLPPAAGEETYIEQVLRNLLSNAGKYGGSGPVVVTATADRSMLTIRVADSGPGFPPDEVGRLFDLFYRSPSAVRRAAGAGIGLFVSRELAVAMGGQINAENRPDGGAEFSFTVPVFVSA